MPGLTLTPAQLATVLEAASLHRDVGSPLPSAEPLARTHPDHEALLAWRALRPTSTGIRPNRALVSALRACAVPDEVLWVETPVGAVTVCRRGQLLVDCSRQPDGRVTIVFPLERAQLVVYATAALSGDRLEPFPSGFAFRGPLTDLFVLRLLADLAPDRPCGRDELAAALTRALDEPDRTFAIAGFGQCDELRRLADGPALDAVVDRLVAGSHVTRSASGLQLTATTATILASPVTASFGVGRRIVVPEADGSALRERVLRIERRGDRLVVMQVVPVDGSPHVELVERSRAEIRSLVGVLLLGDAWERLVA